MRKSLANVYQVTDMAILISPNIRETWKTISSPFRAQKHVFKCFPTYDTFYA